jgi:chloride channel 3/4/5
VLCVIPDELSRLRIDWIEDTLFERARRRREAELDKGGNDTLRGWLKTIFEASQSWFVVSLVGTSFRSYEFPSFEPSGVFPSWALLGAAIGTNAALIAIVTEWLSDLKMGHCSAGFWLNRKFCCWEIDIVEGAGEEACQDWIPWTNWSGVQYIVYVVSAVTTLLSS